MHLTGFMDFRASGLLPFLIYSHYIVKPPCLHSSISLVRSVKLFFRCDLSLFRKEEEV